MKQKKQIIALLVLLVVTLLVWGYRWYGPRLAPQTLDPIRNYKVLAEQDSAIRWDKIEEAQKTDYKCCVRDLFSAIPQPPPTPKPKSQQDPPKVITPVVPPPPPVAVLPPNLKYFGYGIVPNGTERRAFFTDGEDVYVVTEGGTLLGRYRVLKIGNTNLEFQEISSGLRGTAPLEEQSAPPSA